MDQKEKNREIRLRRAAERQGLMLVKSRRRDPHATGYGLYVLVKNPDQAPNLLMNGKGMSLDQIEQQLHA